MTGIEQTPEFWEQQLKSLRLERRDLLKTIEVLRGQLEELDDEIDEAYRVVAGLGEEE